jgi:hypothetical protein
MRSPDDNCRGFYVFMMPENKGSISHGRTQMNTDVL